MSFRLSTILFLFCTIHCFAQIAPPEPEEGLASYYHARMHGRMTSSGIKHDKDDFVAAHKTLPFGTFVKVTNLDNGNSVIVTITDRGPRGKNRIIDVSRAAAEELDFINEGIAHVKIEVVPDTPEVREFIFIETLSPKVFVPAEIYLEPSRAYDLRFHNQFAQ
jgi:rare lipoprotein A